MSERAGSARGAGSSRPTLDDVAKLAGVSLMTASRAINNASYVSAGSREKVLAAAGELGFVPHQGARNLATNRAGSIGLIAPMADARFFSDPNIAAMVSGANAALSDRDIQMVVLIAGNAQESDRVARYVRARHVDGAILLSPELVKPLVDDLRRSGVPLVGTGTVAGFPWLDRVVVETRTAVRDMTRLLAGRGAANIALIAGPAGEPAAEDQLAGYLDVVGPEQDRHAHGDYSRSSGRAAALQLLGEDPSIDAVFAAGDVMAIGVVEALGDLGLRIPDDVMVAGYDDSIPVPGPAPALTTVQVPFHRIGRRMAELLLDRLDDPALAPRVVTEDVSIVCRETTPEAGASTSGP